MRFDGHAQSPGTIAPDPGRPPPPRQRGGGSFGSTEGLDPHPGHAAYCVSKAGIHGITRSPAVLLASPHSGFITGETVGIDGGLTAQLPHSY